MLSASGMLGRIEGWDPLLTTEAKYGLFLFLFFFLFGVCARFKTLQTLPPVRQKTVVKTTLCKVAEGAGGDPNTAD